MINCDQYIIKIVFVIQICDIDVKLHLDLMWCIWKEKNVSIFEDCEWNIMTNFEAVFFSHFV